MSMSSVDAEFYQLLRDTTTYAGEGITCSHCAREIPEGGTALVHWAKNGTPVVVCNKKCAGEWDRQ
jgi:hypothetical protein